MTIYSNNDAAVPDFDWMSVGVLTEEIDSLIKPFSTEIPVTVADRVVDVLGAADDGHVASGITYGGKIHLIRSGLHDRAAVVRTLWHELLHFGLRRFLTREQYISEMTKLYAKDAWTG